MIIKSWFKWIRLPNLMVVALTQYLLFFLFVKKAVLNTLPGISSSIGPIQELRVDQSSFHLLVFLTVLITLGGYIINDILDEKIDQVNHPDSTGLVRNLGHKKARFLYYSISAIGLLIAIVIAIRTHYLAYLWIYPLAVGLLYIYSSRLKFRPFAGNITVSIFCAGVAYLMFFIEHQNLKLIPPATYLFLKHLILFYCGYAFLANYIRELIKDAQDIKGDQSAGAQTFPIKYGIHKTYLFISLLSLILLTTLGYWISQTIVTISMANIAYLIITVILPIIYLNMAIYRNDRNYNHLSLLSKLIMLAGIFNLFFYQSYI